MKHTTKISSFLSVILCLGIFLLAGCKDDKAVDPVVAPSVTTGLYVLNEGSLNQNNSTLTYYNLKSATATTDFFTNTNKRGLGDTGNDLKAYGSKLYCVVNGSSQLEVMDLKTGKSVKQLPMFTDSQTPRQPRYIAFDKGFAYVCSYDGTVGRLDTATLAFDKFVTVGPQPDGICVANNKLYVSNSGGLDYPNYAKTVSVVDIASFTETKKIDVGVNPFILQADSYGDVYVVIRGNYADVSGSFQIISSSTDQVKKTFEDLPVLNFAIHGDSAYLYNYDFATKETTIKVLNVKTEEIASEKFITDNTTITAPYAINVDPITGDVYVADAYDFSVTGDVYCFSKEGKKKSVFEAGLNPSRIVFVP